MLNNFTEPNAFRNSILRECLVSGHRVVGSVLGLQMVRNGECLWEYMVKG